GYHQIARRISAHGRVVALFPIVWQLLNNKVLPVTIYNVVPFNKTFWNLIKNSQECPTNTDNVLNECFNNRCTLQICPYGLKQQSP
ncbi:hypothetical protein U4U11_24935, partial [Escherichia coli]|nr:hypothetical protein [Escherichia coli]